jgi:hypothetical protein
MACSRVRQLGHDPGHRGADLRTLVGEAGLLLGRAGAVGEDLVGGPPVVAGRLLEAHVGRGQERQELGHALRREAAQLGERRRVLAQGAAVGAERTALGLRGAEAHHAQAAGHVLADLGADPVGGIGREPGAAIGIEANGRLEQADVALLDEIVDRRAPAPVLAGDGDDEGEARLDQAMPGVAIAGPVAVGEIALDLGGQGSAAGELRAIGPERRRFSVCAHHSSAAAFVSGVMTSAASSRGGGCAPVVTATRSCDEL